MRHARLADMTRGWLVGDFHPTALHSDAVEVAVRYYAAGETEALHHHRIATEVTVVVSGEIEMLGRVWGPGDIVVVEPGEATTFRAREQSCCVVVKQPGVTADKYAGSQTDQQLPRDANALGKFQM